MYFTLPCNLYIGNEFKKSSLWICWKEQDKLVLGKNCLTNSESIALTILVAKTECLFHSIAKCFEQEYE